MTQPAASLPRDPGPNDYGYLDPVLADYACRDPGDPARERLREQLIVGFSALAQHLAQRFAHRGVAVEDLTQVGMVGLIHAVDRYDPQLSTGSFISYAIPTIQGEIRRYFRDHTWAMRVPRRLKELHLDISTASTALAVELQRAPRPSEIAARLDISIEEVLEGLHAGEVYSSASLDQALQAEDTTGSSLGDRLGQADARIELVQNRHALTPLLAQLPERERTILLWRFFGDKTQTQIAQTLGISQMHVSRLLRDTLTQLRHQLLDDTPPCTSTPREAQARA